MKHTHALLIAALFLSASYSANSHAQSRADRDRSAREASRHFDGTTPIPAPTPIIQQRKFQDAQEWLLDALKNSQEVKVRAEAAKALGTQGNIRAITPLFDALYWDEDPVRLHAVESLEKLGLEAQGTAKNLEPALQAKNIRLKEAVERAIKSILARKKAALEETMKALMMEAAKKDGIVKWHMDNIGRLASDVDVAEDLAFEAVKVLGQTSAINVDIGIDAPERIRRLYFSRQWKAHFTGQKTAEILMKIVQEARPPAKEDLRIGWGKDREWIQRQSYDPAIKALEELVYLAQGVDNIQDDVREFIRSQTKNPDSKISTKAIHLYASIRNGFKRN